ncbi:MAG: hypothetical protein B0D91_00995 [Oceanospirillales bacterium LUC14_002_19_P2]|nr:MAG: hypothetical protein B0D91_00995 [Oceanospirillales bacterium LUC14_002_19_P2]
MTVAKSHFALKKLTAVVLVGAVLAGCQTTNPYTGEQETQKSAKYSGLGALAGAVVGGLANGKDGALAGAALGAAAGGGYGYYVDQQENKLRAELRGTGVQVQRVGNQLNLIMPGNITFASSSANIRADFYPVLGSVARVMKEYDNNTIVVVGHTDSTGDEKRINMPLSKNRANSVADYLIGQGIPSTRITAYGVGSSQPIASNKIPEGRAENRRVTIALKPPANQ